MSGQMYKLSDIAGGDFSDWIYGTSAYTVPTGFEAYALDPGSSGVTIDTGTWMDSKGVESTITAAYKSQWIDQSVTGGTIFFDKPVTSITLSAGTGMLYCRKSRFNIS